ncbi:MAG TPA: hypothetical protein VM553_19300 [Dongiaceae bacterium]|nr:hypothetical protein [Dongiaceae bacterium]
MTHRKWLGLLVGCGLGLTLPALPAVAEVKEPMYMQVLLGQLELDDNSVTATRDGTEYEGELDDIPYLGGVAQVVLKEGVVGYGWEGGGFVSWINDEVYYAARSGPEGTYVRVAIDNAFWSIETFMGLWAELRPIDRLRLYASAGPLIIFGRADTNGPDEDQQPTPTPQNGTVVVTDDENHDTDWSAGAYARVGLDIRITGQTWVGLNVRHMKTEMDLEEAIGRFDIDGNLYLLSITNRY